jgi:hypothetical protein
MAVQQLVGGHQVGLLRDGFGPRSEGAGRHTNTSNRRDRSVQEMT